MDVKKKKIIDMHNSFFEKKIFFIFIFIVINMISYTILIIPLYKYICSLSENNNNLITLFSEEKFTRFFYWSDYILLNSKVFNNIESFNTNTFLIKDVMSSLILINTSVFLSELDNWFSQLDHFYLVNSINNNYLFFFSKINLLEKVYFNILDVIQINYNSLILDNYLIDNKKWFQLIFLSKVGSLGFLEFKTLQETIIVIAGETVLVFFRLYNPTGLNLTCLSYYLIFPNNYTIYVSKLQCFCFDTILINSFESIDLPVLFFIDSMILKEINLYNRLYLYYLILLKN